MLAREPPAERAARFRDGLPEDGGVGAREVDVLENAEGRSLPHRERRRGRPPGVEDDDLAGLDVAQRLGVDEVERARLGGDDARVGGPVDPKPAERQRPDALRVARRDHAVPREEDDRVGAAHARERLAQRAHDVLARASAP